MKQSKSIFERIRLYRINHNRIQMDKEEDTKKLSAETPKEVIKKQSKLKIFFKFVIGFIAGFFEYLVMKNNKKNSIKNNVSTIKADNNFTTDEPKNTQINSKKLETINSNSIPLVNIEKLTNIVDNSNKISQKIDIDNKLLAKKIDNLKKEKVETQKDELKQTKNQLIVIEEQIIYADSYDELETAKKKILKTKQELQLKKNNNLNSINSLGAYKNRVIKNYEPIKENNISIVKETNSTPIIKDKDLINEEASKSKIINNTEELKKESQVLIIENIFETKQDIIDNDEVIDTLIERCDEDLTLVEEKKEYIDLQFEYEQHLNSALEESSNFKLNKKDLKQIKSNINNILAQQQSNLEQLNRYMNMPHDSQMFIAKISNFLKSTAKLSFSFVPFFIFPNRFFGLTTSAIMFNNSLKSYRMQPNMNYINQNIKMMISNNELCLKFGINASKDALGEINNIKYYLNNLPSNIKDTIEYRKYLVDVYSTEKIVKKQIEVLQKMSKKYENIKVKVKRRDY
ncbi:MAG: hypothetical protein HFI86_02680 [Bacilli bacterium]|nr:hypothetical protein [Bacilli bacterium]